MDSLFRDEAVRAQRPQSLDTIRLATPVSHRVWAIAALAITILLLLWLFLGHYTRREKVSGTLVPQAGLLDVAARSAATVTRLDVQVGTRVHAGEILLELSGDRVSAALGDTGAIVGAELRHEQAGLRTDLVNSKRLTSEQAVDLRMQQRMLRAEIKQTDAQLALQRSEVTSLYGMLQRMLPLLSEGYISQLQIQQQRTQELDAKAQVKELVRQRAESRQQLNSLGDQLTELPFTAATKSDDLRRQIDEDQQALAQSDAQQADVLRAPVNGVVSAVLTKPGQAVEPGQSLVSIMPRGSRLQAQLLVPSSAIGFVRVGTPVVLYYQAFPYQKFGVQRGKVAVVSRSALTPSELSALLGQPAPRNSLYLVDVKLDRQSISAYGSQQTLMPGMALNADLLLDHRRMIQWIFEPLYGMAKRSRGARNGD